MAYARGHVIGRGADFRVPTAADRGDSDYVICRRPPPRPPASGRPVCSASRTGRQFGRVAHPAEATGCVLV